MQTRDLTDVNNAPREYAERFLQYFSDHPLDPAAIPLDLDTQDWHVLLRLAGGYCFIAPAFDEPMGDYWTARKEFSDDFIKSLKKVRSDARKFVSEHVRIETRREVWGIRKLPDDSTISELDTDVYLVSELLDVTKALLGRIAHIQKKRKPLVADDRNFFLFLMDAFLKLRGWTVETAIHQEIAYFVNAHIDAARLPDNALLRDHVRQRLGHFRERNEALVLRVEADVWKYVERATGLQLITENPKS